MTSNSETPMSPITTRGPDFTFPVAAVNESPVELDSTPASPEQVRRRNSRVAPDQVDGTLSTAERERRKQLAETRKADRAVIAVVPQTPGAEELEQAGAACRCAEVRDGGADGEA